MTTHYIEEAERLCDRVAIVDHGTVIALGSPRELKERSGDNSRLEVRLARPEPQKCSKHWRAYRNVASSVKPIFCIANDRRKPLCLS